MRRALDLARRGWGRVAPNPLVGAVLLRGGRVIGEGHHAEYGHPHAEAAALAEAGDARGATCVVNLEPCAHHGRTPPCTDALIDAGVARVVFAVPDPHREAAGGAARLKAAGVEVGCGLLAREAAALNAPFLWHIRRPDRPFVALKLATTVDGYLADRHGSARWISGEEARAYVHWLRAGFDAIGIGRVTAEADDPRLTVRGTVRPRRPPTRVVFSRSGTLPRYLTLVQSAPAIPTLVTGAHGCSEGERRDGVEVVPGDSLAEILAALATRGIRSILVEGGGRLASALLADGLVDRLYWIQAPRWLAGGTAAFPAPAGAGMALEDADAWVVTERRALAQDTLLVLDRELCLRES